MTQADLSIAGQVPLRMISPGGVGHLPRYFTSPAAQHFLVAFLSAGLLFEISAFRMQLSGNDPSLPIDVGAGSVLVQVLTMSAIVAACGLLFCSRRASAMVFGTWPIFLLPALAFASMLWSPDPEFTLRKSVAFTGTALFGFLVATASRRLFGGALHDPNGIQPAHLHVGSRTIDLDLNLAVVIVASVLLIGAMIAFRTEG